MKPKTEWHVEPLNAPIIKPLLSRERLAFHEAGHTVAAVVCKLQISKLIIRNEIDARGPSLGKAGYGIPEYQRKRIDTDVAFFHRMMRRMIMASMAGRITEEYCADYNPNCQGARDDIEDQIRFGHFILADQDCQWYQFPMYAELEELLVEIKRRAIRMVKTHRFRRAVDALAFQLMTFGTVEADQALEITLQALHGREGECGSD